MLNDISQFIKTKLEEIETREERMLFWKRIGKNFSEFYIFIVEEKINCKTINTKLETIHKLFITKYESFEKNLTCFVLKQCQDTKSFKQNFWHDIITVEDDYFYANKFIVPYSNISDITNYIEEHIPLFYSFDSSNWNILSAVNIYEKLRNHDAWVFWVLNDELSVEEVIKLLDSEDVENTMIDEQQFDDPKHDNSEGYYIKSITINNFRNSSYEPHDWLYNEGTKYDLEYSSSGWSGPWLVTLTGPNGLGKTTFYYAIRWLLFGANWLEEHKKREQSGYDINVNIQSEQKLYFVNGIFVNDLGEEISFVRTCDSESWNVSCMMKVNDWDLKSIDSHYISKFFNISESTFDHFMYLPQDKYLKFIVDSTKGERGKLLSPLIWTMEIREKIKKIGTKKGWLIKDLEVMIKDIANKISDGAKKEVWINKDRRGELDSLSDFLNGLYNIEKDDLDTKNYSKLLLKLKINKEIKKNIESENAQLIAKNYNKVFDDLNIEMTQHRDIISTHLITDKTLVTIKELESKITQKKEKIQIFWNRLKVIELIKNKESNYEIFQRLNLEENREFFELVKTYCSEANTVKATNEELEKMEKNIVDILQRISKKNKNCPVCLTEFNSNDSLVESIQTSLENLKKNLDSSARDWIYKKILNTPFYKKESTYLDEMNKDEKLLKTFSWVLENYTFTNDLVKKNFSKIISDYDSAYSGKILNEGGYLSLSRITEIINSFNDMDLEKLKLSISILEDIVRFENFKEQSNLSSRLEKIKEVRDRLKMFVDKSKTIIWDYEELVLARIKDTVEIYTKSIIKFQQQWDVTMTRSKNSTSWVEIISEESNLAPDFTFSQWQLAAVAIWCLLSLYKAFILNGSNLKCLLIDDPLQTIDDLNILNFINILRYEFWNTQLIVSTHERNFDIIARYKFKKQWLQHKTIDMAEL